MTKVGVGGNAITPFANIEDNVNIWLLLVFIGNGKERILLDA